MHDKQFAYIEKNINAYQCVIFENFVKLPRKRFMAVSTFQSKVQVIYKEHFCNFTLCLHRTKKALKDNVGVTFFGALFIIFKRMAML